MLLYPGVWMTLTWSILAAVLFSLLSCQLTASRSFEYGHLDEEERSLEKRESGWRITEFLLMYCSTQWMFLCAGSVFLMLGSLSAVFEPAFFGKTLDDIAMGGGMATFVHSGILMALLRLSSTTFGAFSGSTFSYASALITRQIRLDLFRSLIKQEIAFFDVTKSGEMVSRLSSDCQIMAATVSANVDFFLSSIVISVGSLCVMIYMSWRLTLVDFIAVPLICFFTYWYGKYCEKLSTETQAIIAKANNKAAEALGCMRTVRSFACEVFEAKAFQENLDVTLKMSKKR
ncbi:hypothetical protein Aduo_000481 [Ancylostoma duodenale]